MLMVLIFGHFISYPIAIGNRNIDIYEQVFYNNITKIQRGGVVMLTKIGTGQTTFKEFAVDFGDRHIYIGHKGYPKGFFANAVLNIRKDEMAELLRIAAPAFHAFQDMMAGGYSEERFDSARFSVLGLKEKLFKRMPLLPAGSGNGTGTAGLRFLRGSESTSA